MNLFDQKLVKFVLLILIDDDFFTSGTDTHESKEEKTNTLWLTDSNDEQIGIIH